MRRGLLATAALLILAACSGTRPIPPPPPPPAPSPSVTSTPPRGGEATIGAERWPECLNPITSCGQPETYQTVLYHVLPRAMQFAADGSLVASPLLIEAPTLDNGGLTQAPFTVRYRISDRAIWDDGSPITSEDFAFTWRAILHTRHSVLANDYRRIVAVDTSDPKTLVLLFDEPWAGWPELFGGTKGFILKQSAFPNADPQAPNLSHDMLFDMPFSGGPFRLLKWKASTRCCVHAAKPGRAVLERNERYFGPKAFLDRVTFVPAVDLALEVQSLLTGDLDAINLGAQSLAASGKVPFSLLDSPVMIRAVGGDSVSFNALWFNDHEEPLDDPLVREALLYAIDRGRLTDELIRLNNTSAQVLNCGFLALPHDGHWCRTRPFEGFSYDPAQSIALLEEAGYDCSDLPCVKNGKPLEVQYITTSVNVLQTNTQAIVLDGALSAGFDLKVVNYDGVLFGSVCPSPHIAITGCSVQVPPDASVTPWFACDQIRPDAPLLTLNRLEWCNPEADRLMKASDRELDPARRATLLDQVYAIEANDMIGLPLYAIPTVVAWRENRLAGPIDRYLSSPYGPFFNISEWYRAAP